MQKILMTWVFFVFTNLLNAQNAQLAGAKDSLACDTVISLDGGDVVARRKKVNTSASVEMKRLEIKDREE